MADHYPRGYRELKGSFFNTHGPVDTMSWFCDHGVELKVFFGQMSHFYSTILHKPVCICCYQKFHIKINLNVDRE